MGICRTRRLAELTERIEIGPWPLPLPLFAIAKRGKGKGHGPISILSVNSASRRVRQIPIPTHLKQEVEQGVRRFTEIQTLLKQISYVNQDLLEERKKR